MRVCARVMHSVTIPCCVLRNVSCFVWCVYVLVELSCCKVHIFQSYVNCFLYLLASLTKLLAQSCVLELCCQVVCVCVETVWWPAAFVLLVVVLLCACAILSLLLLLLRGACDCTA